MYGKFLFLFLFLSCSFEGQNEEDYSFFQIHGKSWIAWEGGIPSYLQEKIPLEEDPLLVLKSKSETLGFFENQYDLISEDASLKQHLEEKLQTLGSSFSWNKVLLTPSLKVFECWLWAYEDHFYEKTEPYARLRTLLFQWDHISWPPSKTFCKDKIDFKIEKIYTFCKNSKIYFFPDTAKYVSIYEGYFEEIPSEKESLQRWDSSSKDSFEIYSPQNLNSHSLEKIKNKNYTLKIHYLPGKEYTIHGKCSF